MSSQQLQAPADIGIHSAIQRDSRAHQTAAVEARGLRQDAAFAAGEIHCGARYILSAIHGVFHRALGIVDGTAHI